MYNSQRLENFENSMAEQIILGGTLGDLSLNKRNTNGGTRLSIGHSVKQKDYLDWKVDKLRKAGIDVKFKGIYVSGKGFKYIQYYSLTYQELNKYYKMFYRGNKKIVRRKTLNLLEPLGLAVWFQDDGCMNYPNRAIQLSVENFSYREVKMMEKYFATVWHITARINKAGNTDGHILRLGANGTRKFIKIVKPYILPLMEYKVKLKPLKHNRSFHNGNLKKI